MKNKKIIQWVIIGAVASLAVVIVILFAGVASGQGLIKNWNQIGSNLPDATVKKIEEEIVAKVKNNLRINELEAGTDALVRNSSYEETKITGGTEYSFLVDIDKYKVSYRVDFAADEKAKNYDDLMISCPSYEEMKYADSDCRGGGSGVEEIEMYLPHYIEVGNEWTMTITSEYSNENKNHLKIRVSTCGDEAVNKEAAEITNEWIASLGYNPENFRTEILEFCDGSYSGNGTGILLGVNLQKRRLNVLW